jgi:DnaJ-class molecular chaperone
MSYKTSETRKRCPNCEGKGKVTVTKTDTDIYSPVPNYTSVEECTTCDGVGAVYETLREGTFPRRTCSSCEGKKGYYVEEYESYGDTYNTGKYIERGQKVKKVWQSCSSCGAKGYFEGYTSRDYSYRPDYDSNKKSEGCFITTAVCQSKNLPDNSYELNAFRNFRDCWLQIHFPKLVEEYYQIAPLIVCKINQYQDSRSIYQESWENHLVVCLNLLEKKKEHEVKEQYMLMVHELENKFLK